MVADFLFLIIKLWVCEGALLLITLLTQLMWLLWFSTLRRWRGGKQVEEWEAHNSAIQAVIKLPSGELVTGNIFILLLIISLAVSPFNSYLDCFPPQIESQFSC